jgi:hypothetical protein
VAGVRSVTIRITYSHDADQEPLDRPSAPCYANTLGQPRHVSAAEQLPLSNRADLLLFLSPHYPRPKLHPELSPSTLSYAASAPLQSSGITGAIATKRIALTATFPHLLRQSPCHQPSRPSQTCGAQPAVAPNHRPWEGRPPTTGDTLGRRFRRR